MGDSRNPSKPLSWAIKTDAKYEKSDFESSSLPQLVHGLCSHVQFLFKISTPPQDGMEYAFVDDPDTLSGRMEGGGMKTTQ